jgi:hypothetical protein
MNETSSVNYSSMYFWSFCDVWLTSTDSGSVEVRELSAAAGTSDNGAMFFACSPDYSSGSTTLLYSVNSSANYAAGGDRGSALARNATSTSLSASAPSLGKLNAAASGYTMTF